MKGDLFVISAPSGAGKTTLCRRVMSSVPDVEFSVSYTTRMPRNGERDGVDYHFVDQGVFRQMIEEGAFLEWAKVHDNFYGTGRACVAGTIQKGTDIFLDIDVQGARQVRRNFPGAVTIFVMPPSLRVLEERLRGRGSDPEEVIVKRLKNAAMEMAAATEYDHLIVNDHLDRASELLGAVVLARRSMKERAREDPLVRDALASFDISLA